MEFKKQLTKQLLEKHLLYFIEVLEKQYVDDVQEGDTISMYELENKIQQCMIELELLGI